MAGDFRTCCRTRRGNGPHTGGCTHYQPAAKVVERKQNRAVVMKAKEFVPSDGSWVKMHRVEGVWSASLVLLDGRVAEVEDADWHWCLELLAARIGV